MVPHGALGEAHQQDVRNRRRISSEVRVPPPRQTQPDPPISRPAQQSLHRQPAIARKHPDSGKPMVNIALLIASLEACFQVQTELDLQVARFERLRPFNKVSHIRRRRFLPRGRDLRPMRRARYVTFPRIARLASRLDRILGQRPVSRHLTLTLEWILGSGHVLRDIRE